MSEEKKPYPTHRISFSAISRDEQGREQVGKPVEVATVWPRKDPTRSGGVIEWHLNPASLGDGVYFQRDAERQRSQGHGLRDGFDQVSDRQSGRDTERGR